MVSEHTRASDDDRNDTCQVLDAALGDGQLSTEEHRERASAATKATTLGKLAALVSDLQIHETPVRLPTATAPARGWGIPLAVALVVVLLGVGIAWRLHSHPSGSGPSASSTSTLSTAPNGNGSLQITTFPTTAEPPSLLTLSGVTGVLAQMRAKFGDTLGYQLNIYQDQAVVRRPDNADARKTVTWVYRSGSWTTPGSASAGDSRLLVGDLSKFDVRAVLGVVHDAPQILHIYGANQVFLAIESRKDGDGSLNINIHVSAGVLSGFVAVAPDGTVKEAHPLNR